MVEVCTTTDQLQIPRAMYINVVEYRQNCHEIRRSASKAFTYTFSAIVGLTVLVKALDQSGDVEFMQLRG